MHLNSFHIRLVTHFGGLFLLVSIGLTVYLDKIASSTLSQAKQQELQGIANAAATLIARKLYEREREIALLAKSYVFRQMALDSTGVRERLLDVQMSYPFYAWIGVADTKGVVKAATADMLAGQNVAQRPWFSEGLKRHYVGDVHKAVLLEKLLGKTAKEPLRFIDFASPVLDTDGQVKAVLAAHVKWDWVHDLVNSLLPEDHSGSGLEILILSQQQQWLHPYEHIGRLAVPAVLPAAGQAAIVSWQQNGRFVTATANVNDSLNSQSNSLGWQIVLRQPVHSALKPVAELNRQLLLFCLTAMVLGMMLAYWLATLFSRPVEQLAKDARKVALGDESIDFAVHSSLREVRYLAKALRSMTAKLARKRLALEQINQTLEQQVAHRTADLEKANEALQALSRVDALTQVANRRAADEKLNILFSLMQRGEKPYAVLLLDIDHFKQVNDSYGHAIGDNVIQRVATVLQSKLRETDMLARYGGEEFIILLPATDQAGAKTLAEKLCNSIAADTIPVVGRVTISVGVALANAQHNNPEQAVRFADEAMYQAKRAGRNQVCHYDGYNSM